MTTRRIYDMCVAGDDPFPDDICPDCHANIEGWRNHPAHRPGGGWIHDTGLTCRWTKDELSARAICRRLIAEGVDRDSRLVHCVDCAAEVNPDWNAHHVGVEWYCEDCCPECDPS